MQHRVRGSSRDHHDPDGVFEGRLGHDVPGLDVVGQEILHSLAGPDAFVPFLLRIGGTGGGVGKGHAQGLDGRGHGVGRVHASARPLSGTGVLGDLETLLLRDLVVHVLSVGLKGRHDVERVPGGGLMSRADGAAVDHDGRSVESREGDDAARHVLIAAGEGDESVVPLGPHGGLDGVRDEIAGLKGKTHARGAHGYTVGDSNGVETVSDHIRVHDSLLDQHAQVEEVHVAGITFVPHGTNSHLRFVHILLLETGGVEHGLGSTLFFW
mmetsp:Transcript_22425/g.51373  ORF Transcript_22425/g.51373 Transcript_22425/m.51373 type:complete len:268 (-) Transcript_22425:399-1202(-)